MNFLSEWWPYILIMVFVVFVPLPGGATHEHRQLAMESCNNGEVTHLLRWHGSVFINRLTFKCLDGTEKSIVLERK